MIKDEILKMENEGILIIKNKTRELELLGIHWLLDFPVQYG